MIKTARKPSSDPIQEKLRKNKADWNKSVSSFIDDLISFKKMMNGAPSKFLTEKSRIIDPIPSDPITIIGVLANDFQEIATKGNALIQEQINYSKNRKKKQSKVPGIKIPDLATQLANYEQKYELIAEGSNFVSRFFTKLFNPTIGIGSAADLRRARMSMLNACAETYRYLGKFQALVVGSSKSGITDSSKKLQEAWNKWTLVSRAYVIYKNSKSVNVSDKGGTIESQIKTQDLKEEKVLEDLDKSIKEIENSNYQDKSIKNIDHSEEIIEPENILPDPNKTTADILYLEKIKNMVADYRKYQEYFPDYSSYLNELDGMVDKYIATKGKKINPDFEKIYLQSINSLNQALKTTGNSFKDIYNQLKTPLKEEVVTASSQIEKVSQDFIKKWVGKTLHNLSLFDNTSTYRLNCYELAKDIREILNNIMNLLEKGLDEEQLDPLIKEVNGKMTTIRGMMRSLHLSTGK